MGSKHLPSYYSGEYTERNKRKYKNYKRVGMHSMSRAEMRRGSRSSGMSTEAGIGLVTTRQKTRERHTRSNTRNNFGNRRVHESQVSVLWNSNQGGSRIGRVVTYYEITMQGLSENSLSVISATTLIPRARDNENHFFCSLKRGGPIGKVLVHRWLLKCHQQKKQVILIEQHINVVS